MIGSIPELARRRYGVADVVALGDAKSASVEAYRTVRTTLQFVGVDGEGNVIQVVRPRPEVKERRRRQQTWPS